MIVNDLKTFRAFAYILEHRGGLNTVVHEEYVLSLCYGLGPVA